MLSFFRSRGDLCRRAFLIAVGAAVGFAAYSLHWYGTLRYAEAWDGTEQTLQVRVMEAPAEFDYYTRLHVQRTENPKLDLMLYDYRGSIDPDLEPGRLLSVTAKLRRADLRYGERSDSYVSKDIYLTGTLHEITEQPDRSVTLRTLAALCSRRISKFADAFFSPDTGVFMRSLMLGDKTDFYRDLPLYASMRGAGFMHIVAVSGMHIAFLVGIIQLLFGARPASSVFGILLVWFFVFMTGASPSAVRAGTMQTILLMAPVFRRENDGPTSLAAALALILLMNPFRAADRCHAGSFPAERAEQAPRSRCGDCGFPRGAGDVSAGDRAALRHAGSVFAPDEPAGALGCLALLLLRVSELPFGNAVPAAGPASGFSRGDAGPLSDDAGPPHLQAAAPPGCDARHRDAAVAAAVLPAGVLRLALEDRRTHADCAPACPVHSEPGCRADRGQAVVPQRRCGGRRAGRRAGGLRLRALRRYDPDVRLRRAEHAGERRRNRGVSMLLEMLPVRRIILSPDADADAELLPEIQQAAEAHGTELILLRADSTFREGNITVQLFSPPDSGEENERCIISLVSVGDYDLLYTGDSPKRAELQLIQAHALPDTELLVVGHHGSDTSTDPAFLDAVRAEQAVISVGRNNSYGHPSRQVLARLQSRGMEIYRTDRNGTVEVRVNAP